MTKWSVSTPGWKLIADNNFLTIICPCSQLKNNFRLTAFTSVRRSISHLLKFKPATRQIGQQLTTRLLTWLLGFAFCRRGLRPSRWGFYSKNTAGKDALKLPRFKDLSTKLRVIGVCSIVNFSDLFGSKISSDPSTTWDESFILTFRHSRWVHILYDYSL